MTRLLRVLIVEDSEDDAAMLLDELRRGGFEVVHVRVQTGEAMRAALETQSWDVVVSDYSMPVFSGIGALTILKETGIDIPLIIASGTIGEETAVEALKAGASDFLVKDRLSRLIPAIERETREAKRRKKQGAIEQALAETRERMHFALEAAGVGIWETELPSGRTTWSDILEQLHGLPVGGFRGSFDAFLECVHPEDRQRMLDRIALSGQDRSDSRLEYRTTWPDGSMHWVAGIGRTFYSETGEPIRSAGVCIDITAQKDLEEQFRQAQKLESIGGLAAGIAHDFNNLLTVITGYCQLLVDRFAGDAAAIEELDEIQRASSSATELIHQLLAFSRRQLLTPQVVDLDSIVTNTHKMLRRLIEENVQLDLRLAGNLAPIVVDAGQIEQVLLNLVINAKDAMPHGGVVTIETDNIVVDEPYARVHLDVHPGSYVRLSVSDTGSGMSDEVQARLFEPFFTTKERGRGTGLGLATVYGIVKQSRGHIWVYSEMGIGTTFKVYLPIASHGEVSETGSAKPLSTSRYGNETILVVEDEASVRTLTERILRHYGYTVLVAANGEQAERVCADYQGPIHVVLTDVILPGGNGRTVGELVARLRPDARVLYMSGYTDHVIAGQGVLDPGTPFLQKPFMPDALVRKIRDVLS